MFRSLLSLLLAGATVAATAQTAPKTAARPPAAPHKAAAASAPAPAAVTSDTATATSGSFGNGAAGSSPNAAGQGQGVYAAPGMAVDIKKGKEVEPYNATNAGKPKPARKARTLSPK